MKVYCSISIHEAWKRDWKLAVIVQIVILGPDSMTKECVKVLFCWHSCIGPIGDANECWERLFR